MNTNHRKDSTKHHKDMLGMDIPENYFKASQSEILKKLSISKKEKSRIFYLRPVFKYAVAASVVVLIGLGIVLKNNSITNSKTSIQDTEISVFTGMDDDDILINSIFVNDEEMDMFLDHYLIENVLVKVELQEQTFDDVFMNSVLVKDSLIDTYIDDHFIENIIL